MSDTKTPPGSQKQARTTPWGAVLGGLAVLGLLVVGAAAWALGFFTPEPDEVSLEATVESLESDDSEADTDSSAVPSTRPATSVVSAPEVETSNEERPDVVEAATGIDGTWEVVVQDETFVGYRADSRTGEAVGRSPGVVGSLEAAGSQITAVDITADMTRLQSDSSVRDDHLGDEGVEHRTYPTSRFTLTAPIDVGTIPADGVASSFTAVGDLTVRDVTKSVTIDLEGVKVGDELVIVGSTGLDLDDFGASISGTDTATMEFSLVFARS